MDHCRNFGYFNYPRCWAHNEYQSWGKCWIWSSACQWGINIRSKVNCNELMEYAKNIDDNVVVSKMNAFLWTEAGQNEIIEDIKEKKLGIRNYLKGKSRLIFSILDVGICFPLESFLTVFCKYCWSWWLHPWDSRHDSTSTMDSLCNRCIINMLFDSAFSAFQDSW